MPYIVFFFAVILPIVFWVWFIRSEDRSEPESGRLMRSCFYRGIGAGIVAGIIELILFRSLGLPNISTGVAAPLIPLIITVLFVGLIEEGAKYFIIRWTVYFRHDFNQVFDGIVYGITIALGFSFVENVAYFINLYTTQTTSVFLIGTAFRGLFTTLGHVTFTGILGYFVGKAKFSNGNRVAIILQGLIYAALLHAVFDFLLSGPVPYGGLFAALLITVCFFIFVRIWRHSDVRMVWKFVPALPVQQPMITPQLIEEAKKQGEGWVYKINGKFSPDEKVSPEAIVGAWKVEGGNIVGDFIPNK